MNEEHEEDALKDPVLQEHLIQYIDEEKIKEGTNEDMQELQEFDVKDSIPVDTRHPSA